MTQPHVIARLRKERGLTQEQLAAAVGVKQKDISRWEGGKHRPTINTLLKIAAVFGCSLDDMIEGNISSCPDPIPFAHNYKSSIARLRKERGLTQEQLAAAVGSTDREVSLWESGIVKPTPPTCTKLASIFSCSVADLFEF